MKRKGVFTTENTESTEATVTNSVENPHDLPDDFQMTELGPLPKEWRVVRLGEVAMVKYGKAKPINEQGNIPVIGSGGIYGWTTEAIVDFATIIIGRKGAAGNVWLSESPSWPSDTTFYLEWKSHAVVDIRFLYGWFLLNPLSGEHAKTTIPSLQRPDLENLSIPLPPLDEQREIAHVLRTVQRAKEATDSVIAALKELKKSLMQHLFTYGPVPVGAKNFSPQQETEIGTIPAHWRVVRLGEVVERPQYGYTASANHEKIGPKLLRITDIQDDNVYWPTVPFCSIEQKDLEKYRLTKGDILVARIGATTGKTYLVRECPLSVFASYLIRIRTLSGLLPEYLYFFTHTVQYWEQIDTAKGGRLKQGINIPVLTTLLIPLPPLDEQREIARILQAVDAKIAAEQARRAALEELFKTLLDQLMTGKIRVRGLIPTTVDSAESAATED